MDFLKALTGIDVQGELKKALSSPQVKEIMDWVKEEINCLKDRLDAIKTMLAYEHGLPVKDVPPHDPRRLPLIARAEDVTEHRFNLSGVLGKPVTRGEVINIGDTKALVYFVQKGQPEQRAEMLLPPGTTFAFSFFFDALEVKDGGEGAVSVQVVAQ